MEASRKNSKNKYIDCWAICKGSLLLRARIIHQLGQQGPADKVSMHLVRPLFAGIMHFPLEHVRNFTRRSMQFGLALEK